MPIPDTPWLGMSESCMPLVRAHGTFGDLKGGGGLPLIPETNNILQLVVINQLTRHPVCCTLQADHPLSQAGLVWNPLSCHAFWVWISQVMPHCAVGLKDHTNFLTNISTHDEPFKEPLKYVYWPLKPLWECRGKEAVVSVEKYTILCIYLPKPSPTEYVSANTINKLRITEFPTFLKIVGDRGSPCVNPQNTLSGVPKYPLYQDNMVRR